MKRLAVLLLTVTALAASAADDGPPPRKLVLQPRAEPVPALKYRLLPTIDEQQAGNAALDYYRAFMPELFGHRRDKDIDEKMEAWRQAPLGDLPVKEMAWLHGYGALKQCDQGARRLQCDWDLPARLKAAGAATLLPDVQAVRELARLLALRARLEMAEGKLDQALRTVQTGLALSRHVGEAPTLINGLVGLACAQLMLDVLEELLQQPEAPNLYWALSALPRPFIDMRVCFAGERLMFNGMLPELSKLEERPLTPPEALELHEQLARIGGMIENPNQAAVAVVVAGLWPEAKQALAKQGFTEKQLKEMPAAQVVAIHGLREYRRLLDDRIKWVGFPFEQAQAGLQQADAALKNDASQMTKFLRQILLATDKTLAAQVRVERRIAALRVLEAIRLHAAQNEGKAPAKLEAINVVPVPLDPVFDKPFEYRVHDDHVELFGLPVPGVPKSPATVLHYRVEIRKK